MTRNVKASRLSWWHLDTPEAKNCLVVAIGLWGFLMIMFSNGVLSQLVSDCGRLVIESLPKTLASNHATLKFPKNRTWSKIELRYSIKNGEALNIVLDRRGDEFSAIRISRLPFQESAYLAFSGGVTIKKIRLPRTGGELPAAGRLTFFQSRENGIIRVYLGLDVLADIPVAGPAGGFEANLSPPNSPELFNRLAVARVVLDDGTDLPADHFSYLFHSPIFLLIVSVILSWVALKIAGPTYGGLFPRLSADQNQGRHAILLGFTLLVLVIGYVLRKHAILGSFFEFKRIGIRLLFLAWYVVVLLILAAYRRISGRLRWSRARGASKKALALSVYLGLSAMVFVFLAFGLWKLIGYHSKGRPRPAKDPTSATRIICYGGSSTLGYPYVDLSYPKMLEQFIRRGVDPTARVCNRGIEAGTIKDIREMADGDVADLLPTHVVIDSVANNHGLKPATIRETFRETIARISRSCPKIYLVEEPQIAILNPDDQESNDIKMYEEIRRIGRERKVKVINPRGVFLKHRDDFLFMDGCHLTYYGKILLARIIAEAMFPEINVADLSPERLPPSALSAPEPGDFRQTEEDKKEVVLNEHAYLSPPL